MFQFRSKGQVRVHFELLKIYGQPPILPLRRDDLLTNLTKAELSFSNRIDTERLNKAWEQFGNKIHESVIAVYIDEARLMGLIKLDHKFIIAERIHWRCTVLFRGSMINEKTFSFILFYLFKFRLF